MNSIPDSIALVDGEINNGFLIAVVIPCYRVVRHIAGVIAAIGPEVGRIYCVDDACPEGSGNWITENLRDPRIRVIRHETNKGVGGAVMTGYRRAIAEGAEVIVKIDGDGQMLPSLIPHFARPILAGEADYTKGNRFWDLSMINNMPLARRLGNLVLSFMAKASTGYWNVFDPTNGYTAIHADVARRLPMQAISERYFFESDLLFRLNTLRAVVVDVPMDAVYGDETSGLKISRIINEFAYKHVRNMVKRVAYNYFLRDMSLASLELLVGSALLAFGTVFGVWHWWRSAQMDSATPVGTIMIATIAIISGMQFLLAFLSFDFASVPKKAIHPFLGPCSLPQKPSLIKSTQEHVNRSR